MFTDANSHAVLSTQSVSSFHTGVYMNYTISGNVLITIHEDGRCQCGPERTVLRPTRRPASHGSAPALGGWSMRPESRLDWTPIKSARSNHHPLGSPLSRPRLFCRQTPRRALGNGINAFRRPVTNQISAVDTSGHAPGRSRCWLSRSTRTANWSSTWATFGSPRRPTPTPKSARTLCRLTPGPDESCRNGPNQSQSPVLARAGYYDDSHGPLTGALVTSINASISEEILSRLISFWRLRVFLDRKYSP